MKHLKWFGLLFFKKYTFALCILFLSIQTYAQQITILHTNDVHSHFDHDKSALELGGVARHKTAIRSIKATSPNTFLVDGGDWSEGSIFYHYDSGAAALRMMDSLGYDAAVIGNHDWINGPDALLDILTKVQPNTAFISANLSSRKYPRSEEFSKAIPPFVIKEKGGVKIAFIGLSTYEFVYDKFFAPIQISNPFRITHRLASHLKKSGLADVVVALSHNSVWMNKWILRYVPDLDLIIGGHDHAKLIRPVKVGRWPWRKANGWIVEAGCWGEYLGKIDLDINDSKQIGLINYQLLQMDFTVPEDTETLAQVETLKHALEDQYQGPIFQHERKVADNNLYLNRYGLESYMGNLVTDAYLSETHADFAIESYRFIYGELHPGTVTQSDVISTHPAIFNPATKRSWTLKTAQLSGKAIKWLFHLIYATNQLSSSGLVSVSGLSLTYNPWFHSSSENRFDISRFFKAVSNIVTGPSLSGVEEILIKGQPIDTNKFYTVALSDGFLEVISFINSKSYVGQIAIKNIEDHHIENWQVLSKYMQANSPLTQEKVSLGGRIQTLQPDLGVHYNDLQWKPIREMPEGIESYVYATVKNYGKTPSPEGSRQSGPRIVLLQNANGINYAIDPKYQRKGRRKIIRSLQPGETQQFIWRTILPRINHLYPVTVRIEGIASEVNHSNDEATRWFKLK